MSKLIKNNVALDNQVSADEFLSWEFNNLKEAQGRDVSESVMFMITAWIDNMDN